MSASADYNAAACGGLAAALLDACGGQMDTAREWLANAAAGIRCAYDCDPDRDTDTAGGVTYFAADGSYGDASGLVLISTACWTDADWRALGDDPEPQDALAVSERVRARMAQAATA